MSNEALDRRIAEEFMGWELKVVGKTTMHNAWVDRDGVGQFDESFSPTTDMRAAYVALEKIASKFPVTIEAPQVFRNSDFNLWIAICGRWHSIGASTMPLVISKLAEAILNRPEHMELFNE